MATSNLGYLFLTEFFVDSYIGIVIWACLDPANPFVGPTSAPFAIGLAYAVMVWGFADITISTNLARDLGTPIVAAIFFGGEAFSYLNYSWIAILVNVPATLFATGYYEFLMRDSLSKIGKGHAVHEHGEEGLRRHITNTVGIPTNMIDSFSPHSHLASQNTRDLEDVSPLPQATVAGKNGSLGFVSELTLMQLQSKYRPCFLRANSVLLI